MKKLGSKLLGVVLGLLVFYGVQYAIDFVEDMGMDKKIDALAGVYYCAEDGQEQIQDLLELADFYEEETAQLSNLSLEFVKGVEFTQARTYRFFYDAEASRKNVYNFYDAIMHQLYDNRAAVTALYGEEVVNYTWEEFAQIYAEWYGMTSYEELLTALADNAYDYNILGSDFETGTYTIDGDDIMCTITGEYVEEALGYEIDGQNLTLTYSDMVEYYTRAN